MRNLDLVPLDTRHRNKTLKQLVAAADMLGLELHIQLVKSPMCIAAEATLRAIHELRKKAL